MTKLDVTGVKNWCQPGDVDEISSRFRGKTGVSNLITYSVMDYGTIALRKKKGVPHIPWGPVCPPVWCQKLVSTLFQQAPDYLTQFLYSVTFRKNIGTIGTSAKFSAKTPELIGFYPVPMYRNRPLLNRYHRYQYLKLRKQGLYETARVAILSGKGSKSCSWGDARERVSSVNMLAPEVVDLQVNSIDRAASWDSTSGVVKGEYGIPP